MAPSRTGRWRRKASPSRIASSRTPARELPLEEPTRTGTSASIDSTISTALTAYATLSPCQAISTPPSAGPLTEASDCSVELTVMARANSARGTSIGISVWRAGPSKAEATPMPKTHAYSTARLARPLSSAASITADARTGTAWASSSTRRRL
jgi:hypothetical protein